MNLSEAKTTFQAHAPMLAAKGIILPGVRRYVTDEEKMNGVMAMDASTGPLITDPNSSIPAMLTTTIDPEVIRVILAPLEFANMVGERRKGSWVDDTALFPIVESTGEVSTYGDYNNNGRAGVNFNYPAFQSYLFQTILKYGEREIDRVGLMKINLVSEIQIAASMVLNIFQNLSYAFGIQGLQNYGIINNPYLSAYITPATKAAGGTAWFNGNSPNATANEVYNDVIAVVNKLIAQTMGAWKLTDPAILAVSPQCAQALTFTNSFGVSVADLMKKGYPNIKVVQIPQYGQQTATNYQGASTAGNVMQLIPEKIQGQQVVYAAYNEKLRAHKIVPGLSDWSQKMTSGTWGTIIRTPAAITGMIGI